MKLKKVIEFYEYKPEKGIRYSWEEGFEIKCLIEDDTVSILANKEGLLSLANHLVTLAQDTVPAGDHMHFDEYNSLEAGSKEIVICKTE